MGMFDKVFKKKDSEFEFPSDNSFSNNSNDMSSGLDNSMGFDQNMNSQGTSQQGFDSFGNPAPKKTTFEEVDHPISSFSQNQSGGASDMSKDIQLMIAKLDAIKAEVSHINQRVEIIERRLDPTKHVPDKKYLW